MQTKIKASEKAIYNSLLNFTAHYFDIWIEDLKSNSKKRPIVHAKQMFISAAMQYVYPTPTAVGLGYFLGFDHSTIIYHMRTVKSIAQVDEEYAQDASLYFDAFQSHMDSEGHAVSHQPGEIDTDKKMYALLEKYRGRNIQLMKENERLKETNHKLTRLKRIAA